MDDLSTASEDSLFITINKFPVMVIGIEKCENTLDALITEKYEELKDLEWGQ